jgi:hypothetical protein
VNLHLGCYVEYPRGKLKTFLNLCSENRRSHKTGSVQPTDPAVFVVVLQIQRSRFDSRRYQIFWEAMGFERSPLSLVSTIEELFGLKSSGSGLENWEYGCRDPSRWPRDTLCSQHLLITSPTSGCRSVCIVRSRTQATEFSLVKFSLVVCHVIWSMVIDPVVNVTYVNYLHRFEPLLGSQHLLSYSRIPPTFYRTRRFNATLLLA